jgi:hypothetical protein
VALSRVLQLGRNAWRSFAHSDKRLCCLERLVRLAEIDHFPFLLRSLRRPTRKYLKATRPSPAGNSASHFRQRILPRTASQASIVTILYSASQLGQRNGIGSGWLIV